MDMWGESINLRVKSQFDECKKLCRGRTPLHGMTLEADDALIVVFADDFAGGVDTAVGN